MAIIAFNAVGASATGDIGGFEATDAGILLKQLRALGHSIVERTDTTATHYLSLDHYSASLAEISSLIPVANRVLVVLEPRVVKPTNYRARIQRSYGHLLAFTNAAGRNATALPLPQRDWRQQPPASATRIPGTTVLINGNKLSSIPGSQYGLRRKVIQAFSDAGLPLTLAGSGWLRRGRATFVENLKAIAYAVINLECPVLSEWAVPLRLGPSVKHIGMVDDKEAVLLEVEFVAAIENSRSYVSEKLFDAVVAGCVPLYVGAPLPSYGIPAEVAIALPSKASAFVDAVRTLTTEEKDAVLAAGRAWLALDETHATWAMGPALRRLADEIDARVRQTAV